MRRPARAGDDDLEAGRLGALGEGNQPVRWAETMRFSQSIPSTVSVSAAWRMVSQSDWLPMMMAIGAVISSILLGNPET
jgi:hypothetical protein